MSASLLQSRDFQIHFFLPDTDSNTNTYISADTGTDLIPAHKKQYLAHQCKIWLNANILLALSALSILLCGS